MNGDDLADYALFVAVVEQGGFTAAGAQTGMPKSSVSRRIALLEARLGVRLLQRSSRHVSTTSIGQQFYERCQAMVALGREAHEVVRQAVAVPQGPLRVSCPLTLAQVWLTPLLPRFAQEFPRVRLMLSSTSRRVDPVEEPVDVALRVRRPPFEDSALVVRTLGRSTDVLVAAPRLVGTHGMPSEVGALRHWPTLALSAQAGRAKWVLNDGTRTVTLVHEARLVSDDMLALRHAAVEGLGLALLPELICVDALARGTLRRMLPQWHSEAGEIQAAFASRRGMLPAVRAFIDFLAAHPPLQLSPAGPGAP